jgi:hypothetical protein
MNENVNVEMKMNKTINMIIIYVKMLTNMTVNIHVNKTTKINRYEINMNRM